MSTLSSHTAGEQLSHVCLVVQCLRYTSNYVDEVTAILYLALFFFFLGKGLPAGKNVSPESYDLLSCHVAFSLFSQVTLNVSFLLVTIRGRISAGSAGTFRKINMRWCKRVTAILGLSDPYKRMDLCCVPTSSPYTCTGSYPSN